MAVTRSWAGAAPAMGHAMWPKLSIGSRGRRGRLTRAGAAMAVNRSWAGAAPAMGPAMWRTTPARRVEQSIPTLEALHQPRARKTYAHRRGPWR